jgi:hypothetical protein
MIEEIFKKSPPSDDPLHDAMARLLGEFPNGKVNADDEGALALEIGAKDGNVFIRFPKPVAWIGFTGDQAIELAQSLIDNARKAGLSKPVSIKL